jgi:hypothetical protein
MLYQRKLLKILILGCGILFWTNTAPVMAQTDGLGFESRLPIGTAGKRSKPLDSTSRGIRPRTQTIYVKIPVKLMVISKSSRRDITTRMIGAI